MKTIGMIGGMSWESSVEYYRLANQAVKERLGDLHSARIVMVSVDFAEIETLQREGRWDEATRAMIAAARQVQAGGADFLLIFTNTMHKMADEVQASIAIPLLHIADATAAAVKAQGLQRVGLLGTRFTMEGDFYRGRLAEMHGLEVLLPEPADREIVHRVIYEELVLGRIEAAAKAEYLRIIAALVQDGAEGIILGCTEIGSLIQQADSRVPLFDTTRLHALAAVDFALKESSL
jgi:aspartate racemase